MGGRAHPGLDIVAGGREALAGLYDCWVGGLAALHQVIDGALGTVQLPRIHVIIIPTRFIVPGVPLNLHHHISRVLGVVRTTERLLLPAVTDAMEMHAT